MRKTNGVTSLFRLVGWFVIMLCWLSCSKNESPDSDLKLPPKTNFLVITLDTLRQDHLSGYGYPRPVSPNLDRVMERGTSFINMRCSAPYTNPSHASLFTGLYPWLTGCRSNYQPLQNRVETWAEYLKKSDYKTAAFVSGSPLKAQVSGLDQGFDTYDDNMNKTVFKQTQQIMELKSEISQNSKQNDTNSAKAVIKFVRRSGEDTAKKAISWLSKINTPWFLWVHFYDSHGPYKSTEIFKDMFEGDIWQAKSGSLEGIWIPEYQKLPGSDLRDYINRYDRCIYYQDKWMGSVMSAVQRLGFSDNTCIVIVADHGESLGENGYGFDHGKYLYRHSLRIPCTIKFPNNEKAGELSSLSSSIVDIFPALLSITEQSKMNSKIDFQKLSGSPYLLTDIHPGRWCFAETKTSHPGEYYRRKFGVFNEMSKYVYSRNIGKSEFYHLLTDPAEKNNLVKRESTKKPTTTLRRLIEKNIISHKPLEFDDSVTKENIDMLKSLGYMVDY